MDVVFTKLSSKGQIVIPTKIRESMHLEKGAPFAVIQEKDMIIFKKIKMPEKKDFNDFFKKRFREGEKSPLKPEDVQEIVHEKRKRK